MVPFTFRARSGQLGLVVDRVVEWMDVVQEGMVLGRSPVILLGVLWEESREMSYIRPDEIGEWLDVDAPGLDDDDDDDDEEDFEEEEEEEQESSGSP